VKTTIEIPDSLFRQAKAVAAQEGRPLKDFFTEAIQHQLRRKADPTGKPWKAPSEACAICIAKTYASRDS
jgi:hypothetical protein